MGDPLTGHEKVRMVSLTGSIATGNISSAIPRPPLNAPTWSWAVKRRLSSLMMPTWMRLSKGCGRLVSTMPDRTVRRRAGFMPEGHLCRAGGKAGRSGRQPQNGAPEDDSTELGPLSSAAHLSRVCQAVNEAKALGHIRVVTVGAKKRGLATTSSQPCWRGQNRTTPSFQRRCLARW